MKDWKEVYKLPLRDSSFNWVYDANGVFVFQFLDVSKENKEKLIMAINGNRCLTNPELSFINEGGIIKTNKNQNVILIRGWGHLAGTLNLSEKEAVNVQNTFAEFIVSNLNCRNI